MVQQEIIALPHSCPYTYSQSMSKNRLWRRCLGLALASCCLLTTSTHAQSTPPPFNKHPLGAMAYTQSGGLFYIQGGEYGPGTPNGECVTSQLFALDLTQPWADLARPAYFHFPSNDNGGVINSYHVATHSLDHTTIYTLGWNSGAHRSCATEPGSGDVYEGISGTANRPSSLIMRYKAKDGQWAPMPDGSAVPNALTEGWRDFQGALSSVSGRYLALSGNAGINGTEKRNQQLVLDTATEVVSLRVIPAGPAASPGNASFSAAPSRNGYGIAYVRGGQAPGWFVLGGTDGNGLSVPFTSLDVLKDTESMNEWSKVTATGAAPSNRDRHCVASDNTRIFVYGGFANSTGINSLHILDTNTMSWKQASNTGTGANAVGYTACTVVGDQFIVWAGFTTSSGKPAPNPAGALRIYDASKDTWVTSYTPPADYQNLRPILPPGFTHPNDGKSGPAPGTPGDGGSKTSGSNAAVIGGAAGGAVALIIAAAVAFFLIRRRKQRKNNNNQSKEPSSYAMGNVAPSRRTRDDDDYRNDPSRKDSPPSSPPSPSKQLQSPQQDPYRFSTTTSSDYRLSKADPSRYSVADSTNTQGQEEYSGPYYLPKLRKINRASKELPEMGHIEDTESINGSKEDLSRLQIEEEAARKRMNEAEAASMTIPTPTDRRSRAQSEQFTPSTYAPEYLLIPLDNRNSVAGSASVATRPHSSSSDLVFAHHGMTPRWSMVVHPNSQSQSQLPTVPEVPMAVAMVPTSSANSAGYVDGAGTRLSSANSHLESRLVSWYGGPYQRPPMPPGAVASVAAHTAAMGVPAPGGSSPSTMSYESSSDPISALTSGLTSFPDTSAPLSPLPPSYPPPPPLLVREVRQSPQFIPFDPNNPNSKASSPPVSPPFGATHIPPPPTSGNTSAAISLPNSTQGPVMTWAWPTWATGVSGPIGTPSSTATSATTPSEAAAMAAAAAAAMGHPEHLQYTPHLQAVHLPAIESPLPSGSLVSTGPLSAQQLQLLQQQQQQAWELMANYKIPHSGDMSSVATGVPAAADETASSASGSSPSQTRMANAPQMAPVAATASGASPGTGGRSPPNFP